MRHHVLSHLLKLSALALCFCGCSKGFLEPVTTPSGNTPGTEISAEIQIVDQFASEMLSRHYYYQDDVRKAIGRLDHTTCQDPIMAVHVIKNIHDKWTALYEDISPVKIQEAGTSTSFGYHLLYCTYDNKPDEYCVLIAYVEDGSPAQKAGLCRGLIITSLNHQVITEDNLELLENSQSVTIGIGIMDEDMVVYDMGAEVKLQAAHYKTTPILSSAVLSGEFQKTGYLCLTDFTLDCIPDLVSRFKWLKENQCRQMVLDLRYSSRGYALTEQVLASMLAPRQALENGDIYQIRRFNPEKEAENLRNGISSEVRFQTAFQYQDSEGQSQSVSIKDANLDLNKLYVITSEETAGCAEALIASLKSYMDVVVIGKNTRGVFMSGIIIEASLSSPYQSLGKWGLHVMTAVTANKDGLIKLGHDGIREDVDRDESPQDGTELGNPEERMLRYALALISGKVTLTKAETDSPALLHKVFPGGASGCRMLE